MNAKIYCSNEEFMISLLYYEGQRPSFYIRVGQIEYEQSMFDGIATVTSEDGCEMPTAISVWETNSDLIVDLHFAFKTMYVDVDAEKLIIPKKKWGYRFRGYRVVKSVDGDITAVLTFLKDFRENKVKVSREYVLTIKQYEATLEVYYLSSMERRAYLENKKTANSIYIGPNEKRGFYVDVNLALEHLLK